MVGKDKKYLAHSGPEGEYKQYVIRKLEKNVVAPGEMNFIFSTGLKLKEGLIDPEKVDAIMQNGNF